jgi:hypothetical protein
LRWHDLDSRETSRRVNLVVVTFSDYVTLIDDAVELLFCASGAPDDLSLSKSM